MPDRYQQLVNSPLGRQLAETVGLPRPEPLRRHRPGAPVPAGPVFLADAGKGQLGDPVARALADVDADVHAEPGAEATEYGALICDASGLAGSEQLRGLHTELHPRIKSLTPSGRVIVLGTPPDEADEPRRAAAQQALEGFTRSIGKELRRGSTAQLVQVRDGGQDALDSTLTFLLSGRSAYVSGQVVRVGPPVAELPTATDRERPLDGKVAVVTGAARGIGASIADVLARDGAHVVCLDLPAQGHALAGVANRVGGSTIQLDLTDADAPAALAEQMTERHGGIDVLVHNAGITRDKTLAGMAADRWDAVLDVNLSSQERVDQALLDADLLRPGGRIVAVSSLSGIAGNRGQTNYAASKAGVIGRVRALAPALRERHATANAVAPGFIETDMTAAMPLAAREAGRRMNSLGQGGLPVDVAETVAWFAHPGSSGVTGNVVRVCGQSLLGA